MREKVLVPVRGGGSGTFSIRGSEGMICHEMNKPMCITPDTPQRAAPASTGVEAGAA